VPTLTTWFTWSSETPYYYAYGPSGNVYYDNNVVYVNGQQYATGQQYYEQAAQLAQEVPEYSNSEPDEMDWLPLGVWALTKEGVSASNILIQLAVNREGVIAGMAYNETTGVTHPLEGSVDATTQRAAWRMSDGTNEDLVMETGLFNLTESETIALMHYGPEKTQEIVMVRMDQPEDGSGQQSE